MLRFCPMQALCHPHTQLVACCFRVRTSLGNRFDCNVPTLSRSSDVSSHWCRVERNPFRRGSKLNQKLWFLPPRLDHAAKIPPVRFWPVGWNRLPYSAATTDQIRLTQGEIHGRAFAMIESLKMSKKSHISILQKTHGTHLFLAHASSYSKKVSASVDPQFSHSRFAIFPL